MIEQYAIIFEKTEDGLSESVTDALQQGYQPYGEPFKRGIKLCQAVVKRRETADVKGETKSHAPTPPSKGDKNLPYTS